MFTNDCACNDPELQLIAALEGKEPPVCSEHYMKAPGTSDVPLNSSGIEAIVSAALGGAEVTPTL